MPRNCHHSVSTPELRVAALPRTLVLHAPWKTSKPRLVQGDGADSRGRNVGWPAGVGAGARKDGRCQRAVAAAADGTQRSGLGNSMSFDAAQEAGSLKRRSLATRLAGWSKAAVGRLLYHYYNWRKDTMSDLQLFLGFNLALFLAGASLQGALLRQGSGSGVNAEELAAAAALSDGTPEWWLNLYAVCKTVFGQDMPGLDSALVQQVFALATVAVGLASFALVLALVEQVVLEVLTVNVKVGSCVYEEGHTVLLCWCQSAGEAEQETRLLKQLCLAYREDGGRTIVVLTQRGKLEMEAAFREAIPQHRRHGCTLVFRRGSPLDPRALQLVSCATAGSIVISGDYSCPPMQSDAQVVRAAVLLDELLLAQQAAAGAQSTAADGASDGNSGTHRDGRGAAATAATWCRPTVVAQIKTLEAHNTLKYTCGGRVQAVPTKRINAARLARLLRQPVAGALLQHLSDFGSHAQLQLRPLPLPLAGKTLEEIQRHLPGATVLGLRRGGSGSGNDDGHGSSITQLNTPPLTVASTGDHLVLLCGSHLQVLRMPLPSPRSDWPGMLAQCTSTAASSSSSPGSSSRSSNHGSSSAAAAAASQLRPTISPGPDTASSSSTCSGSGSVDSSPLYGDASEAHWRQVAPHDYHLPPQYYGHLGSRQQHPQHAQHPQQLLVCGWGGLVTMHELLEALDSGSQALPPGSLVALVNNHKDCADQLEDIVRSGAIRKIALRHVHADPRSRAELGAAIDIAQFAAALVLCDPLWHSASNADAAPSSIEVSVTAPAGYEGGDGSGGGSSGGGYLPAAAGNGSKGGAPDALRLDAAVLGVQLNIRMLLLESRHQPDLNIVCEKQSYIGVTRYEDTDRLPLGITFNTASFSAKLLAQVAVEPRFLEAYQQLGSKVELATWDAAELAGEHEELTYAQLQAAAARTRQAVLLGFFRIPESSSGIQLVLNPPGEHERTTLRVWNSGDGRCKLLMLVDAEEPPPVLPPQAAAATGAGAEGRAAEAEVLAAWFGCQRQCVALLGSGSTSVILPGPAAAFNSSVGSTPAGIQ